MRLCASKRTSKSSLPASRAAAVHAGRTDRHRGQRHPPRRDAIRRDPVRSGSDGGGRRGVARRDRPVGSNASTAEEAAKELAAAEADRAALIGLLDLHVIVDRKTMH